MKRILFIDRDGTLIKEPADEQIDSFEKLTFTEGMFKNLSFIKSKLDFEFVMVSNQDGLGTDSFPEDTFWPVHNFILKTLTFSFETKRTVFPRSGIAFTWNS